MITRNIKWLELQALAHERPYFGEALLHSAGGSVRTLRNQFSQWRRQGKIWRLRNGLYTLAAPKGDPGISLPLASNVIYSPSYVSLEFALAHYGLIPERVYAVTAVTSRKTRRFRNELGTFIYRHLKPALFGEFETRRDEHGRTVFVAGPEKALLDKIYLDEPAELSERYFLEDLRLQNLDLFGVPGLRRLAKSFGSARIGEAVRILVSLRARKAA